MSKEPLGIRKIAGLVYYVHDLARVRGFMLDRLDFVPGASVDYVEFVNPQTLRSVKWLNGPVLLALAVKFGSTRLIDNLVIQPAPQAIVTPGVSDSP